MKAIPKKNQLRIEIALVIAIKLILLTLLWYICFSHPIADKLNANAVSDHLLGIKNQTLTI